MNKTVLLATILLFFTFVMRAPQSVAAISGNNYEYTGGCTKEIGLGGCYQNRKCITSATKVVGGKLIFVVEPSATTNCSSSDLGAVKPPGSIARFDQSVQGSGAGSQSIGIILFASNLLQLFSIIAGIWAMFNFLYAGYMYISAMSDAGVTEKVKEKITMTVVGLAIIAGSYILAGLIGLVMFGDATFIISPKLQGVSTAAPTP